MKEETKRNVDTAHHGLLYAADLIAQALTGEKAHIDYQKSLVGPFKQALNRVAEIADGAEISDQAATARDLVYLWDHLHFLKGGFWASLWDVLAAAHVRMEQISAKEAATILETDVFMLGTEVRLEHLHPIEANGKATWLYSRDDDYTYARYEVEALAEKTVRQRQASKGNE